jgi:hypothetical protein
MIGRDGPPLDDAHCIESKHNLSHDPTIPAANKVHQPQIFAATQGALCKRGEGTALSESEHRQPENMRVIYAHVIRRQFSVCFSALFTTTPG